MSEPGYHGSKIVDDIYKLLKRSLPSTSGIKRCPTKAEVSLFAKKKELLAALIRDEEQIRFTIKLEGIAEIIIGNGPFGEIEPDDLEDLNSPRIKYASRWKYS